MPFNKLGLKSFKIIKLFGVNNVELKINDDTGIFVGENGIGKTTILNVLFFTMTKKFHKLLYVDFESIELTFNSNEKMTLLKEWLETDSLYFNEEIIERISRYLTKQDFVYFTSQLKYRPIDEVLQLSNIKRKLPPAILRDIKLIKSKKMHVENIPLIEFGLLIDKYITDEILYFPTYRRIEEDLIKLGINLPDNDVENKEDIELIQFGMSDVKNVFYNIEEEIKNSTILGYSQVTGEMISHLVHMQEVTNKMKEKIKDYVTLDIVLDRVGKHLREQDRNRIRELIRSNELFEDTRNTYNPLIFFLYNLFEIYEQHRQKDDSIKNFTKVCNSYLVNKEVEYNESTVKIMVIDKKSREPIELSNLSSGEKQIVSLFTRILLTTQNNFILLFDEPELSLSIEWQEKLLEDVINTGNCSFMIAVTHSPFIYNNSLREYAQSMELCISEDN